jgi:hypothetical protein
MSADEGVQPCERHQEAVGVSEGDGAQSDRQPPPGSLKWILFNTIPPALGGVIVYVVVQVVLTVTKSVPTALIVGLAATAALVGAAIKYRKKILDALGWLARQLRRAWKRADSHRWWTAGTVIAALVVTVSGIVLGGGSAGCPAPTELRVLTSREDLAAVQDAITGFEQDEPKNVHSGCYVVHLTAYASKDRRLTALAFAHEWNSNALQDVGALPDIWIPDSDYELDPRTLADAGGGPVDTTKFHRLGSIGTSPLVVALPGDLVTGGPMTGTPRSQPWNRLHEILQANGIELAVPDPEASDTGLFHVDALDKGVTSGKDLRALAAVGDFPPDSASLLCTSRQTQPGVKTAFLVSEMAMLNYNQNPCGPKLVAFYPAGTGSLNFPLTTVDRRGNADPVRVRYEQDFFHWLGQERGRIALAGKGVRPGTTDLCDTNGMIRPENGITADYPSCDSPRAPGVADGQTTLMTFREARAPAQVLIGIDDSAPMDPYLHKITAAVNETLDRIGSRDSLGVWALPGPDGKSHVPLVRLQPGASARSQSIGRLDPHDHSANYDVLVDAGKALYGYATVPSPGVPPPINAVVLLTDGDIHGRDAGGNDSGGVAALFTHPPTGNRPIKLFIIAFGPAGCTTSMTELAGAAHGTCFPATSDPQPLLEQVLGQLSGGGGR